jgi:hypothetical protein
MNIPDMKQAMASPHDLKIMYSIPEITVEKAV